MFIKLVLSRAQSAFKQPNIEKIIQIKFSAIDFKIIDSTTITNHNNDGTKYLIGFCDWQYKSGIKSDLSILFTGFVIYILNTLNLGKA